MKKSIMFVLTMLFSAITFAQTITVSGMVTNAEDGKAIPFATIHVKGTNHGGYTDENGKYSLALAPNAILIFSSIGFTSEERSILEKKILNVSLKPNTIVLDETIVVAYGTAKKGSYSGSASVIKENAIKDAPVVSFEQVLAGKASGVQVTSNSGQPGSEVDIRVRGFGSFNAGNAPLYVIDGVPATSGDYASGNISTSAMNFLNPNDVESITILKDAAAASLYGSRASNGVILITTKKGKMGKLISNFKASAGLSYFAYNNYPLASDSEAKELHRQAWYNYGSDNPVVWKGSYSNLEDYVKARVTQNYPDKDESKYIYKNWEDVLFRKGITQNYEYNISGGNNDTRFYASAAYTDQQGVVKIDYLKRFSTTINAESKINKFIKLGGTMQYSWQYQNGHQEGENTKDNPFFQWKIVFTERWPYAYKDGSLYLEPFNPSLSTINPIASYNAQINNTEQNRLILKGWIEASLTDWLRIKTILSNDWLYVHDKFGWLYGHPNFYAYSSAGGYMSNRHRNINRMVSSSTLNFDKTWGEHHVGALLAWEAEREKYGITRIGKIDFSYLGATESIFGSNYQDGYSYTREEGLLSLASSINYNYGVKYYLTGTYRRDGSSRLGPNTRWGNFWSASASWRFSNESFLKFDWLDDGKLRGSYGTSGTLPSDYFGYMAVYEYTKYGSQGASYPKNIPNPDLSWEKNKNWNIALDAKIFNRYAFTIEYFKKKTDDLLLDATNPSTTGISSSLMNIGSMENKGIELSLNIDIIKKQNWDLSVGINWSRINNKILFLSKEDETIVERPHIWKAGYSFYQYYSRNYLGVNRETGLPMYAEGSFFKAGDIVNKDVILKDGTIVSKGSTMPVDGYNYAPTNRQDASSMILEGKTAIPKGFGGFNVDFRWKDLSFSMAWTYKYGHYIWDNGMKHFASDGYYSFGRNILKSQVDTWSVDNKDASVPRRVANNNQGGYYDSSRFLKEGDFLRLKNLSISYNIPKNITRNMNLANARVYLSGSNLITFSGLDIDPEVRTNGYYGYNMPPLRTFSIGVEISF